MKTWQKTTGLMFTGSTNHRANRWLAWLPLAVSLVTPLVIYRIQSTSCTPATLESIGWLERFGPIPIACSAIGFGLLSALIWRAPQPNTRIASLCGTIAVGMLFLLAPIYSMICADSAAAGPVYATAAWLTNFSAILISLPFLLLSLLFPNGRFLSAGWRRFGIGIYSLLLIEALLSSVWPDYLMYLKMIASATIANPLGIQFNPPPAITQIFQDVLSITLMGGILIANYSLFERWRHADALTRQQIKVLAFFLVSFGTVFMLFELAGQLLSSRINLFYLWGGWLYGIMLVLIWVGYPFVIGVSVLKYRLYDIDLVIRRTLSYSLLSGLSGALYFGGVALLQGILPIDRDQPSPVVIVVTTLVIAALFNPLRRRIQDFIDRRFNRRKYNAERALAEFAATARSETDLGLLSEKLVDVVQQTVQPESTRLWLKGGGKLGRES